MLNVTARLLRLLPAEMAHDTTLLLTSLAGPLLPCPAKDNPCLAVSALGLLFSNPIGLAAGFDKNARVPGAMGKLGFGFVECGTVTPRPQAGNPSPRLFRLPEDRAVINRMGFNNEGIEVVAQNLARRGITGIVGINIGANKDSTNRVADYALTFTQLSPFADYVAVNVSSPNTPGLRGLQNRNELMGLLNTLMDARSEQPRSVPLLLKIAPDLDTQALDDIADVVRQSHIEGLIVSNTTIARSALRSVHAREVGGLSGAPLFVPSTEILRQVRLRLGDAVTLIGVGGVTSGAEAYAKIRAGASLVQLYTTLVYQGPGIVANIKRELAALLTRDGFARIADAVGVDAR